MSNTDYILISLMIIGNVLLICLISMYLWYAAKDKAWLAVLCIIAVVLFIVSFYGMTWIDVKNSNNENKEVIESGETNG